MHTTLRFLYGWFYLLLMMAISGLLLLFLILLMVKPGQAAVATNRWMTGTIPPVNCTVISAVATTECEALVALYTQTDGAHWHDHTNWLATTSPSAPCDWHGVTCAGGHVTQLLLAGNRLSGTLPLSISHLSQLTHLRLENNALAGRIPPTICELADSLIDTSLAYNAFFTRRKEVEACMQQIDPDWLATQTSRPDDLLVTEFYTDALRLSWTPISYTADGGYYEIDSATHITGPYTLHGTTADISASTYLATGLEPGRTYYFLVRTYKPPHGEQVHELRSRDAEMLGVTQAITGNVLLAAYFPADNDLSAEIPAVVERFRFGTQLNPNVQVVMLVDGRRENDTRVLEIAAGHVTLTNLVQKIWGRPELDTADPAVLAWFLQYARTNYPATLNIVTLIGHGMALAPEIDWPSVPLTTTSTVPSQSRRLTTQAGEIPPLPREWEDMPNDVTDNSYLSIVDVGQALAAATDNGAHPFDIIFFDQCFQGNLDSLYEVHIAARVFIASPNYAWLAAAYHKYITQLVPAATPAAIAQAIIEIYEGTLDRSHPNAIFWMPGSDISAIADAVNKLGDALLAATVAGEESKIALAVRQSKYVDTTQCGDHKLELGPPDELIGIDSFAGNLQQAFGVNDPYGVATALDALTIAMERIEKRSRTGNPYIAPDEFWDYRDTITLLAPLPRNSPAGVAWRASIYRSDAPFTATWTLDPSQPVTVTASLAYVRDGHWDEFLAEWYQALTPTVGQWCHYIPPEQVIITDTDPLTLTLTAVGDDGFRLDWTPTGDTTATEYWLYHEDPYDLSWTLWQTLALDQTSVLFTRQEPGKHRFAVLAHGAEEEFVAQSNEITIELGSSDLPQIFLPLIRR